MAAILKTGRTASAAVRRCPSEREIRPPGRQGVRLGPLLSAPVRCGCWRVAGGRLLADDPRWVFCGRQPLGRHGLDWGDLR
jgi:hypothetical protein